MSCAATSASHFRLSHSRDRGDRQRPYLDDAARHHRAVLSFVLGNMIGVFGSWRRGGVVDSTLPPLLIFMGAFPPFFLALMGLYFLGYQLGWFPPRHAYDDALSPAFSLVFIGSVVNTFSCPRSRLSGLDRRLGARYAQHHDRRAGRGLCDHGRSQGAVAEPDYVQLCGPQRSPAEHYRFGMALGFILSGQILIETIFGYPGSVICWSRRCTPSTTR